MMDHYLKEELYQLVKEDSNIFEFLQSGTLDGIWFWDLEKPENEWLSPKFWETLGYDYKEKEHKANEWQEIIHPDDLAKATECLQKHINDKNEPYDLVVRYKHKNHSTVWIRCRGLAIRNQEGKAIRMLGAHVDITAIKEAELDLAELKNDYERVFNGTQNAMFLIDILGDKKFRYIRNNKTHQNQTKITLNMIKNKTPYELLGKEQGEIVTNNYQKCVDRKTSITYEETLYLPSGERKWLTTLTPFLETERPYIVGSATDITDLKKLEDELKYKVNYDVLTNLASRRYFFDNISARVSYKDQCFTLFYLDLNGFKEINDQYGHSLGDKILIEFSKRLKKGVREEDFVGRIGGDEFVIIAEKLCEEEAINNFLANLREGCKIPIEVDNFKGQLKASIGYAVFPNDGETVDKLLSKADKTMYEAKKHV